MAVFTSIRERRLWLGAIAVVLATWATLALSQKLAGFVSNENWLGISFGAGMLLVLAAIAVHGLQPRRAELAVALGIVAVYWLMLVRMATAAERTHLIEYGVVAILIHAALQERAMHGRRVPAPALLAVIATAGLGVLDEMVQLFMPNRFFDRRDIVVNVFAGGLAVSASILLARARRG